MKKESAAVKAATRQDKMETNRAKDEANLAAKKAKKESDKMEQIEIDFEQKQPTWEDLGLDEMDYNIGNIDNLDTVGKIKGDVSITEEDIKLLKDIATVDFINQYTTLQPEMNIQFGDVRETADVNNLVNVIADMIEEAYASVLIGEGE